MQPQFQFPAQFRLRNLSHITSHAFELKVNTGYQQADQVMREWYKSFGIRSEKESTLYMDIGRFDIFAALSFPNADLRHLETCLAFFLWAFSTDDRTDEGELQSKPEDLQLGVDEITRVLGDPFGPIPKFPIAAMLHALLKRIYKTASPGTIVRFGKAVRDFSNSQVQQSRNRALKRMPSVEEFILMRRATIGAALVEAMVEYSLDLNIPDYVFEDPTFMAMSEATTDIMTWPNDLCSFNKEQADGDYQNLVCCIMVEQNLDLQSAVNVLTDMIVKRVDEYLVLKAELPSFGENVDKIVKVYHQALEHFVQGTIVWYYICPRYFRGLDNPLVPEELIIPVYKS